MRKNKKNRLLLYGSDNNDIRHMFNKVVDINKDTPETNDIQ